MPCYTPPPPWQGEQRRNAEQASVILCEYCTKQLADDEFMPQKLLKWFIQHREVDLWQAQDNGWGRSKSPEVIDKIKKDIQKLSRLIK